MNDLVVSPFQSPCISPPSDADRPPFLSSTQDTPSLSLSTSRPSPRQRQWGQQILKPGECMAWTRGRNGWSDLEGNGEVRSVYWFSSSTDRVSRAIFSSNLTFSLSDGLAIVETADWRIIRVIGPGVVRMGVSRRTFLASFVF